MWKNELVGIDVGNDVGVDDVAVVKMLW